MLEIKELTGGYVNIPVLRMSALKWAMASWLV